LLWYLVFIFSPFEAAIGVAKKKRRQEERRRQEESVAQAQAPLRNMTEEKCTIYEVYAKVKRRYGNQAWYSKVNLTNSVRDKWK